jgi:transposase-like protein
VTRRPWTGAERLRLARLADTLPIAALAERFGRTPGAIRVKLWQLRGRRRPEPPVTMTNPVTRAAADACLAAEIAAARAEAATAPLYRGGPLLW